MSELPPDSSLAPRPVELAYETPRKEGNAPTLVLLAGIFNLISAGLDILYAVFRIVMLIVSMSMLKGALAAGAAGGGGAPPPFAMPMWMPVLLSVVPAALSLAIGGIKVWAGISLFRLRRRTWAVGLAGGIAGAIEFWSCPCCVLNMAAGIYTIVVLCMPHVQQYLTARENAAQTS